MRFEPKSDKEIAEANLLPPSDYDFEVFEATDKVSKAGNDMVELDVIVYDIAGNKHRMKDWLVSSEKALFKISHFAKSVGLYTNYENGEIPSDLMVGKVGRCKVGIRKDPNGAYPDKNCILDYIGQPGMSPPNNPSTVVDLDDEIPF